MAFVHPYGAYRRHPTVLGRNISSAQSTDGGEGERVVEGLMEEEGDGEGEGRGGRKKGDRGISKVGSKKRCEKMCVKDARWWKEQKGKHRDKVPTP